VWTNECQQKNLELINCITSSPILGFPDYQSPFSLEIASDASNLGMGATLTQKQHGKERVISYCSMTFTKTERKYSAIEQEALAISWALEHFRPYIYGQRFVVVSDHKP
jgi:hypothetical protein